MRLMVLGDVEERGPARRRGVLGMNQCYCGDNLEILRLYFDDDSVRVAA
ncbi:MAG: hypothetical protein ABR899_07565 [Candidatus Krumholzibacteriaceae bacterium]